MPLTLRSWVQITASFNNFALLSRQIKSKILGTNAYICLLWMGRFILKQKIFGFRCTLSLPISSVVRDVLGEGFLYFWGGWIDKN